MLSKPPERPASRLSIQLLGRPRLEIDGAAGYRFRSRKSWAVLAFLLLGERPPTRSQLASLLFAEADDPLRALRWSLAEIRRGLGPDAALDGDPVRLRLPGGRDGRRRRPGATATGTTPCSCPGSAPTCSTASPPRTPRPSSPGCSHSAAGSRPPPSRSCTRRPWAIWLAESSAAPATSRTQAAVLSPLDENHQALLIRLYRLAGDDDAAERQFAAWSAVAERELGSPPGARGPAGHARAAAVDAGVDEASINAVTEAGAAAVSAGAVEAGVGLVRDRGPAGRRGRCREPAGRDPPGARRGPHPHPGRAGRGGRWPTLTEAERIALADGDAEAAARARAELGYVDFLRGATTAPNDGSARC